MIKIRSVHTLMCVPSIAAHISLGNPVLAANNLASRIASSLVGLAFRYLSRAVTMCFKFWNLWDMSLFEISCNLRYKTRVNLLSIKPALFTLVIYSFVIENKIWIMTLQRKSPAISKIYYSLEYVKKIRILQLDHYLMPRNNFKIASKFRIFKKDTFFTYC